ncbi:hypothetical protein NQK81_14190 [Amycolatopsis roodepoortensis]|nr:hypothetical protein NQK81_14190 [Amycolatopsis roodepoortensis]
MNRKSREFQVSFDAHDPKALSTFWRDALGYVHPGPPGVEVPEGTDPLDAWDEFLERVGVPEDQRNTRSALEDPDGEGPRIFFQQVPDGSCIGDVSGSTWTHDQVRCTVLPDFG